MANRGTPSGNRLVLGDYSGLGAVHVDLEAFFELSFWMAEEIEDLVSEWRRRLPPRRQLEAPNSERRTGPIRRPR